MGGWTDAEKDGRTDDRWIAGWMDDGWMHWLIDGHMDGWTQIDGWMDGWADAETTDRRID